jgi:hypothetical protein
MAATTRAVLAGQLTNPDNAGGPVGVGDAVQNCASLTAVYTAGPTNVTRNACRTFDIIAGPAIAIQAPPSTPLGSPTQATAMLSGGAPTGSMTFRVFAASDVACTTPLLDDDISVSGVGSYGSPDFDATAAGAYKWVAHYNGDVLHAAGGTGCNDPAGAFAVVAPPAVSASFGAAAVEVGESTALTFTITNPSANTVPLTGVALENTLPVGLAVASPNRLAGGCGSGALTAAPGSHSVTLVGGTIPVGSSCSFSVDVTASAPGAVTNTTGAVQSANGGTGSTATASLTVRAPAHTAPAPERPPTPRSAPTPRTAQELALACSPSNLVLLSVTQAGRRVRFAGVADAKDAGQRVVIRTLRSRTAVARATVRADGSFEATGSLPRRRAAHKTRYFAELGARHSEAVKLTRRLRASLTASSTTVMISGRVAPPLDKPIRRVVITRLTSCAAGDEVVARVKPDARGRFRATLPRSGALPRARAGPLQGRRRTADVQPRPRRAMTSSLHHVGCSERFGSSSDRKES